MKHERVALVSVNTSRELADLAAYLICDRAAFINGEVVTIDGGEWLKGAGQFNLMENLSEAEWDAMRGKGR